MARNGFHRQHPPRRRRRRSGRAISRAAVTVRAAVLAVAWAGLLLLMPPRGAAPLATAEAATDPVVVADDAKVNVDAEAIDVDGPPPSAGPECDSSIVPDTHEGEGQGEGEGESTLSSSSSSSSSSSLPDYLIVGAGGSGLQTALLLLSSPLTSSFSVLERTDTVGSFWTSFPRFRELISVNKSVRNATQRYRYDWHSFLGAELGMLDVTDEYFPTGMEWHEYMARVAEETQGLKERIEFGAEVVSIADDGTPCVYVKKKPSSSSSSSSSSVVVEEEKGEDENDDGHDMMIEKRCAKRRIFVGTGLEEKKEPLLRAISGVPYSESTRAKARDKRVCILGNGNSAFEIAQNIYGVADRVTLYGRSPHRLSAVTRYTGDVRVKYLQAVENLNGKLLDTVDYFPHLPRILNPEKLPLNSAQLLELKELARTAVWLDQFECEVFFYATGFVSSVPGMDFSKGGRKDIEPGSDYGGGGRGGTDGRFPPTNDWYAARDNPNVHYVGWLMHERDFRRGAGGFLSGYRYLIRNLVNHVLEVDHGVEYPYKVLETKEEVVRRAVDRFQVADDLIILQDGVVLRDAIVTVRDEGGKVAEYRWYDGVTFDFHENLTYKTEAVREDDIIYLYFSWGDGRTTGHVFDTVWRYTDTRTLINLFLHPVVQVGPHLARDIHEDLDMTWKDPAYVTAIEKVVREALDGKLDNFRPRKTYPYKRAVINQTESPGYYERVVIDRSVNKAAFKAMWHAIYRKDRRSDIDWEVQKLNEAMSDWQPRLFEDDEEEQQQWTGKVVKAATS